MEDCINVNATNAIGNNAYSSGVNGNVVSGGMTMEDEQVFEVFISGPSFNHDLTRIGSKVVKEAINSEGIKLFYHKCDLALVSGAKYTVYTPKILA